MKPFFLLLFIFLLQTPSSYAQRITKVGTTAAGFLNIDVGARAVSMGGAFVSVAEDATAMFWNPSGIARLPEPEAIFSYTRWIADITFNYAAIVVPLGDIGTVGASATFLTMDDMDRTTVLQPEGTGETFDAGSYALGLSYARGLTDRFSIGFNLKYINEKIYHSIAQGMAFDIGTLFTTQFNDLKIGMSISNFGTKMQMGGRDLLVQHDVNPTISGNNENINADLKTDRYDLPLMFRVGVSMDMLKGLGNSNLVISIDALHPNDDTESLNLGGEWVFNRMFALRAGFKSLFSRDSEEGLTLGAGLNYKLMGSTSIKIDYAWENFGVFKEIQKFTIGLKF